MRSLCLVIALSGAAQADVPFVSLDRASGATNAGAHLGLMLFEDSNSDGGQPDVRQPRLQLFGEYAVTPHFGAMISGSVIAYSSGPIEKAGLGAIHVGGYARHASNGLELVARGGIVLPTESFIPRGTYDEEVAVHGTLFPWLEERAIDAGTFWLHGGTSLRFARGAIAVQFDAFVDVPLADELGMTSGTPMRVHLGGGVAYRHAQWRASAELLASGYMLADSESYTSAIEAEGDVLIGLTAAVAYMLEPGRTLVGWFSNPLDSYIRSRWHAIGGGYQMAL